MLIKPKDDGFKFNKTMTRLQIKGWLWQSAIVKTFEGGRQELVIRWSKPAPK